MLQAGSPKTEVWSGKTGYGSWKLEVGSRKTDVRSGKTGDESPKLGVGSYMMGVGRCEIVSFKCNKWQQKKQIAVA